MTRNGSSGHRPPARAITRTIVPLRRWFALAAGMMALLLAGTLPARSESFSEYQVKAVFLYNLVNFVEWPGPVVHPTEPFFTIGILGPDPFGKELEHAVANETVHAHAIRIVRYADPADFDRQPCQLLFVTLDLHQAWPDLHAKLVNRSILTVSDQAGFVHQGGMINLLTTGNRIQLEINLDNARQAGLKISSKLLNLAQVVSQGQ
jgi:hypothetical protein